MSMLLAESVTPATQAITFTIVGGLFTMITLIITNRSKRTALADTRAEKEDDRRADIDKEMRDYARQDALQSRLDAAAAVQLRKLQDVEDLGKVTHSLVNASYTASLEAQRVALLGQLNSKQELLAIRQQAGLAIPADVDTAIGLLQQQIAVLEANIKDRLEQQAVAEKQVAQTIHVQIPPVDPFPPPPGPRQA